MTQLWLLLSGWKTIAAWLLLQIPELTQYPGLAGAIQDALQGGNRQVYFNLAIQVLLAIGVIHRAKKNVAGE